MAKILGKMHKSKVLGADTHSVSLMYAHYKAMFNNGTSLILSFMSTHTQSVFTKGSNEVNEYS